MAHPALRALALTAVALVMIGCDRLPRRWPLGAAQNSVAVKLPPARQAPAPGFRPVAGDRDGL